MIIFITFLMIIMAGFILIDSISKESNFILKLGLSYPVGMVIISFYMFFLDLVGIRITILRIIAFSFTLILIMIILKRKVLLGWLGSQYFSRIPKKIDIRRINFIWWFLCLILLIIIFSNVNRNLYWPVYTYDSVTGYDLSAKVIAAEGKLAVSLFDYGLNLTRGVYPPLSSTAFSIAYMLGLSSSKIIMSFFFISLILAFYGLLKRFVNPINAIFFAILLVTTPELFGYSVLSNTNLPGIIYIGLGSLFFCLWFDDRKKSDLIIAALLLGINVWLRSDGIVFNVAAVLIMAVDALKKKQYKPIILFSAISFIPFVLWSLYLKYKIGIVPDRFVDHPYFDWERIRLMVIYLGRILIRIKMYGIAPILFLIVLVFNWKQLKTSKAIYPIFITISLFLYLLVYYQLDTLKQDPISSMMRHSFRRGYLVYMPMYLFYVSISQWSVKLFDYLNIRRKIQ